MRDARHTWAVRAIRAGMPVELVARQMGHVDGTLVLKVYGRFVPKQAERQRWEEVAAARDAEAIDEAKRQREGKA
jgi:integrase